MQIAVTYGSSTNFSEIIDDVAAYDNAGLDAVWLGESYGFDAISALGALAHATTRVQIGSGIIPVHSRSATLIAQTAAGLDALSNGRFALGLGASGPAVIEGWHGREHAAPVRTIAETIRVCREVWRRERVSSAALGIPHGDLRPLKIMAHPVRDRIPIYVAAMGPRAVESTAEIADGWLPIMFLPERAEQIWGRQLSTGAARRDPDLGPLQIAAPVYVAIDGDRAAHEAAFRRHTAHYVAVMGPPRRGFYYQLMGRYGYADAADAITDAYLAKDVDAASAAVPDEFVAATSLIGDSVQVKTRLAAYRRAGVTMLNATFAGDTLDARLHELSALQELTSEL